MNGRKFHFHGTDSLIIGSFTAAETGFMGNQGQRHELGAGQRVITRVRHRNRTLWPGRRSLRSGDTILNLSDVGKRSLMLIKKATMGFPRELG